MKTIINLILALTIATTMISCEKESNDAVVTYKISDIKWRLYKVIIRTETSTTTTTSLTSPQWISFYNDGKFTDFGVFDVGANGNWAHTDNNKGIILSYAGNNPDRIATIKRLDSELQLNFANEYDNISEYYFYQ